MTLLKSNKKIKNATPLALDGIKFKSKLEVATYKLLKERGFTPQYEEVTFVLLPSFKPTVAFYTKSKKDPLFLDNRLVRQITYTPDFVFEYKGYKIIVEVKGFTNDVFPYKFKMFRNQLELNGASNIILTEIFSQKQLILFLDKLNEIVDSSV